MPILQAYFDYDRKIIGIGPLFAPTGHVDRDLAEIQEFYRGMPGKHPAQF